MNIIETRPTRLKGLNILEVSAVDVAANPMATIIITKRGTPSDAVPVSVTKDVLQPAQQNYKSANFGDLKSESEVHMDEISKSELAESVLDALANVRQQQCPDESTAVAMTKVLSTDAGKKVYADLVFQKDFEIAKSTTLRTYGSDVKKGSPSAATQAAPNGPWAKLDEMAKEHSVAHSLPFHQAYAAVIGSPAGQKLYSLGLKPSATSGAPA